MTGGVWLSAIAAHGTTIGSDAFNYPTGNLVSGSNNGGTGFSGPWTGGTTNGRSYTVTTGTFAAPANYGNALTGGEYVAVTAGTAAASALRPLTTAINLNPTQKTTYYFSTLVSRLTDGTVNGDSFVPRFSDSTGAGLVSFGVTGSPTAGEYLRISTLSGNTTGTTTVLTGGSTFSNAGQYLVIGKLVLNPAGTSDVFSLSIIPASGAVSVTEPGTWDLTRSEDVSGTATQICLYTSANAGTVNADNFYLGTSYASAVAAAYSYSVNAAVLNSYANIHPRILLDAATVSSLKAATTTTLASVWGELQTQVDNILSNKLPPPYSHTTADESDSGLLRPFSDTMSNLAMAYNMTNTAGSPEAFWIEAEEPTTPLVSPMQVYTDDTTISGQKYIATPSGYTNNPDTLTSPSATYTFTVSSKRSFTTWAHIKATNSSSNALWLAIDGGTYTAASTSTYGSWTWIDIRTDTLTPGAHTLDLKYLGGALKIDKFLVNGDPSITPSGNGTEQHWFEAENASLSGSMQIVASNVASNKSYISPNTTVQNTAPTSGTSPDITCAFTVSGGAYDVWMLCHTKPNNGLYYRMDSGNSYALKIAAADSGWIWVQMASNITLAAGAHSLQFCYYRPIGWYDQFLVTAHNSSYTPGRPNKYYLGALDWALQSCSTSYAHWGDETDTTYGQDLGEGEMLFGLSTVYDWMYSDLSPNDQQTFLAKLVLQGNRMNTAAGTAYWKNTFMQNHQWINMTGLLTAAAATFDQNSAANTWLTTSLGNFSKTMSNFGVDGASQEGIVYWEYGSEYLLRTMSVSNKLLGINMYTPTWFQHGPQYRLYLSLPRNCWTPALNHVNFCDDDGIDEDGPTYGLWRLSDQYSSVTGQWLAGQMDAMYQASPMSQAVQDSNWLNLIWYNPSKTATSPASAGLPTLQLFGDMALVSDRSDWSGNESMLAFKCGPPMGQSVYFLNQTADPYVDWGGFHCDPDANNFVLFANGEWLIHDDGYAFKYTSNHNTLLVNGAGQLGSGSVSAPAPWFNMPAAADIFPYVHEAITVTANLDEIVGEASSAYDPSLGLTKFMRYLLYMKNDNTLLVVDDIKASASTSLELRFYPATTTAPVLQGDGSYISTGTATQMRFCSFTSSPISGTVSVYDRNNVGQPTQAYRLTTTGSQWQNAAALTWSSSGTPVAVTYSKSGTVMTFVVNGKTVTLDLATGIATQN